MAIVAGDIIKIGDANWKALSVDSTGPKLVEATQREVIEWEMRQNGGFHLIPGEWLGIIGGGSAPQGFSLPIESVSVPVEVVADVNVQITGGCIKQINRREYDADEKLVSGDFEPNAINEFVFGMLTPTYDLTGTPVAEDPWFHLIFNAVGGIQQHRFTCVFKIDAANYDANGEWNVYEDAVDFTPARSLEGRFIRNAPATNFRISSGSKFIQAIRFRRRVLDDGTILDVMGIRLFCPDVPQVAFQFNPSAFARNAEPKFENEQFLTDNALTGLCLVTNMIVQFSDQFEALDLNAIQLLKEDVSTLRNDMLETRGRANHATALISELQNVEGVLASEVKPGDPVWFNGWWQYDKTETKSVFIPAKKEDFTEAWLKANKCTKVTGVAIETDDGISYFSEVDLTGLDVPDSKPTIGVFKDPLKEVRYYHPENGKWVEDKNVLSSIETIKQQTIPEPYWPVVAAPANTNGSPAVRKGETRTVSETLALNNGFAGSNQSAQTFGTTERGKTFIVKHAIPDANKAGRIDVAARTTAQGVIGDYSLSYANGAWVASGGTVLVQNGMAVFEISVPFASGMDTIIYRWITPGVIQDTTLYEVGKSAVIEKTIGLTLSSADGTSRNILDSDRDRLTAIEGKVNATAPIFEVGGVTRADDVPFITIPDRVGARFDSLSFIAGDGRKVSNGFEYVGRQQKFTVPASWLSMNAVTGRTGWTPETFANRNSLKTRLDYTAAAGSTTIYDIWLQWRRNATSWDIWFQGQHTTTNAKPVNQFCGAYDITANYVLDSTAVDPGLAPLQASITANANAIAANTTAIAAEATRAKKAEGDNALGISTLTASVQVNASSITEIQNNYAKKVNLLKRSPRTKVWAATLAGLTVTNGVLNDATATNQIPIEPDLDAPVFAAIVNPGPATVRFGVTGLVIGEKYEFILKEGIALAKAVGLPTNFIQSNTPDWRVYKLAFTADKTTMDGFFTLTGSANLQGPAVYRTPGVFGHDKDLKEIRLAEPSDVPAPQDLSAYAKLTDIPASGKPPDTRWFNAERDFGKTYTRNTKSGTQAATISFDWMASGTGSVIMSANLSTAGWAVSGFWGAPTQFINVTPPGGVAMTLAVVAHTNGKVEIGVGNTAGASSASIGRVRNVIIDGIAADTL